MHRCGLMRACGRLRADAAPLAAPLASLSHRVPKKQESRAHGHPCQIRFILDSIHSSNSPRLRHARAAMPFAMCSIPRCLSAGSSRSLPSQQTKSKKQCCKRARIELTQQFGRGRERMANRLDSTSEARCMHGWSRGRHSHDIMIMISGPVRSLYFDPLAHMHDVN